MSLSLLVSTTVSSLVIECVLFHIIIKSEAGLSPPVKYLLTIPRRYFFCGPFVLFMSCVCHAFASVHCCLVATCWGRADLLALVCDV